MSDQERQALTYQGAMTGLFDDFFDKQDMPDMLLKTLIEKPDELPGNNSSEKLFLSFYKKALQHAHDPSSTLQYLRKVYEAQVESKRQAIKGSLNASEILRITIQKGGVSVLFYRTVLSNPLNKEEKEALYQMGGLMQLGNDIFDVYKDCQGKIDTPATTATKISEVRKLFQTQMEKSFSLFFKTSYSHKNIKRFLRLISMSLCSRCFVCLDQLEEKERTSNNVFTPHQYNRKDLICDMQKTSNKWKTIKYFGSTTPG